MKLGRCTIAVRIIGELGNGRGQDFDGLLGRIAGCLIMDKECDDVFTRI